MKRKPKKRRKPTALPTKAEMLWVADRLWSRAVRDDWSNRCAVCGHGNVEAHHLVPRQVNATRHEVSNGIALCANHHKFDTRLSPHQNAAGWMAWLEANHPTIAERYKADPRPMFFGTLSREYYATVIRELEELVTTEDYDRIVGLKARVRNFMETWEG